MYGSERAETRLIGSIPRRAQIRIRDHPQEVAIGSSVISPDGQWVVYTRRTVVADRYQTNLWLVPYRGGRPRRLTHSRGNDTCPMFAPDSRTIAFFSDRGPDEEDHLFAMRIDGGDAMRICGARHESMFSAVFSPDGRSIAFVADGGPERFWAGDPKDELARVIRRADWRADSGILDHRGHLYVVDVREDAHPRQLTHGDFDVSSPAWHPSGEKLVFVAATGSDSDIDPNSSIHQISVKGGRHRELVKLAGTAGSPAWSPDGRTLASSASIPPGRPTTPSPNCTSAPPGESCEASPASSTCRSRSGSAPICTTGWPTPAAAPSGTAIHCWP